MCLNCQRQGETCDYSIRLNWDGRSRRKGDGKCDSRPLIYGNAPPVPRQSAQASILNGPNGYHTSPGLDAGPYSPPAPESASQISESTFKPPFAQLNDGRELLPPFLADPPLTSCSKPTSLGPDHSSPYGLSSRVMEAAKSMTTLPQLRQFRRTTARPSTIASAVGTFDKRLAALPPSATSKIMPPPYPISSFTKHMEYVTSPERAAKRVRLSTRDELHQCHDTNTPYRASSCSPSDVHELTGASFQPQTPDLASPRVSHPMTPASSSTNSDEARQTWRLASSPHSMQDRIARRVSVNSLLSGSPELEYRRVLSADLAQAFSGPPAISSRLGHSSPSRQRANSNTHVEHYGLDQGLPDLDIPRNNDIAAINGLSPSQHSDLDAWLEDVDLGVPEFGFGLQKREFVFAKGGYYASPVPINIPKKLEPLPSTLLENPMNLLYFHHFLNHTARILVVHDCSQNPFRSVLPQSKVFHLNVQTGRMRLMPSSGT